MRQIYIVLLALLVVSPALAQVESVDLTVWDKKVNEPGYVMGENTTRQVTLKAGYFDVGYFIETGKQEPLEIDLEGLWPIWSWEPMSEDMSRWDLSLYSGTFLINRADDGEFFTVGEAGLTLDYNMTKVIKVSFYVAKIWGQHSENGFIYKPSVSNNCEFGRLKIGWKALLVYNDHYFLDDANVSHMQGQLWAKWKHNKHWTIAAYAGQQINNMGQFDRPIRDPNWYGLGLTRSF